MNGFDSQSGELLRHKQQSMLSFQINSCLVIAMIKVLTAILSFNEFMFKKNIPAPCKDASSNKEFFMLN